MPANLNFDERLSQYRALIDDMSFPTVHAWKNAAPNRKVVGTFPVYSPHELAHAAGMLPVMVVGAGGRVEIDHADSRIQSFVCSISRSTLELGLTNRLVDFDAMWFPSICDVARNLSGIWTGNFPKQHVEFLHFPQNMDSEAAVRYYTHELHKWAANLEKISGKTITDADLRNSITVYNRNRRLMKELYEIKNVTPWLISTYEAYLLTRMGGIMTVEEHSAMLEEVMPQIRRRERTKRDYIRVILEGSFCEQPPLELLQVLEDAGCYIINDDLLVHTRWYLRDIPTEGDPWVAMAKSYIDNTTYSSVRHYGLKSRKEQFTEKIRNAHVDGVIFMAAKFCEPALLDYVVLKDHLEKEGIVYLAFEYEEKMSVFESMRMQVETFVESIMFYS